MVEPRTAALPFGFQDPSADDFGRLAAELLATADAEIEQRQRRAQLMLLPSVVFYLLFAFGLSVVLWTVGIELRPVSLAVVTSFAFLVMAGLGVHYEDESDWLRAAAGVSRMHRRFLVQGLFVNILTGAFFTIPALVIKNLAALFPRRPRVDHEVLAVATNLAAALDEPVPVAGPEAIVPRNLERTVIEEAALLLVWAEAASIVRRGGQVILQPGPKRGNLLFEIMRTNPYVVFLSALTRDTQPRS